MTTHIPRHEINRRALQSPDPAAFRTAPSQKKTTAAPAHPGSNIISLAAMRDAKRT